MYEDLEVVVVARLLQAQRDVTGTEGVCRQPRVGDCGTVVHVLASDHRVVECVGAGGYTLWLGDFHVDELAPILRLRHWTFVVTEVSAGVYRATGAGPRRLHVESTDTDPDQATADCRAFALRYPE